MDHAPSLLQILPWLLNALRTKPKLPKWPTKSSAIEFIENFPLDLLHYISRSSHSHNRLLLIAACAQTTAPRPPQTSCLQVSAPTAPAPPRTLPHRCLAWVPSTSHSAPFPEHPLSSRHRLALLPTGASCERRRTPRLVMLRALGPLWASAPTSCSETTDT